MCYVNAICSIHYGTGCILYSVTQVDQTSKKKSYTLSIPHAAQTQIMLVYFLPLLREVEVSVQTHHKLNLAIITE